ncbi:MAG TPA: MFS transporter [Anaerolineae bacterium]|nr:MFS transporter [Anaerolineae bacterium]
MHMIPASTIRRIIATLFVAQGLALAALIASTMIASITGTQLGGGEWAAGLPSTFTLIGGALAAYPAGRLAGRFGRRLGLSVAYLCGIVGGLIAGIGVIAQSLLVFLIGMVFLGASRAVSDQARYAAADVMPIHLRARAVSLIVFAGTIGAVLGPILSPIAGRAAISLGYAELVGPWFVTTGLMIVTLIFVALLLRPDPRDIARALQPEAAPGHLAATAQPARSFWQVMSVPAARLALISLGLAQTVMVMVMTITPVHMTHHAHGLDAIGFVISAHILGMYGLSMAAGWLTDRGGRRLTIGLGSLALIGACVLAPQNPDMWPLALSLFLLGFGWNMCFVSGSALLTDALDVHERARIQGAADLVVNLASAIGSLGSGLLIASLGFGTLATVGAVLAMLVVVAALKPVRARPVEMAAAN